MTTQKMYPFQMYVNVQDAGQLNMYANSHIAGTSFNYGTNRSGAATPHLHLVYAATEKFLRSGMGRNFLTES